MKSVLGTPLKDTKLPLGADVTVSRVVIQDFDECASEEHNDCSDQVSPSETRLMFSFRRLWYYNILIINFYNYFMFLNT